MQAHRLKSQVRPLEMLNPYVAGIDIGSQSHFIAVSPSLCEHNIRETFAFTRDLKEAANWLKELGIQSVAMESTGVYWIPFFEILDSVGIEVLLVNARYVKNVPGRKSDVLDCQWIQQLHSYGLLRGAFRPSDQECELRSLMRQRTMLIQEGAGFKLRMQKSLTQMNLQLHNVMSDISCEAGIKILRDIISGKRDPKQLASHRTERFKCSREEIEKSLEGNYRPEHVFALKQALDLHDYFQSKIRECDDVISKALEKLTGHTIEDRESAVSRPKSRRKNELYIDAQAHLIKLVGVDLTEIDGLQENSVLKILSETGTNMEKWPTVKHFTSWLGLSPGTKISGGKVLSSKTKKCKNQAAVTFRLAAQTLGRSQSALGAFLRRKKAHLGTAEAITATAHKIARIFYTMLKTKKPYSDLGTDYYEQRYQDRSLKKMALKAKALGYELVKTILEPTMDGAHMNAII